MDDDPILEAIMRVNARFDAEAEQQVTYLAEVTRMGVSEVLQPALKCMT